EHLGSRRKLDVHLQAEHRFKPRHDVVVVEEFCRRSQRHAVDGNWVRVEGITLTPPPGAAAATRTARSDRRRWARPEPTVANRRRRSAWRASRRSTGLREAPP